LQTFWLDSKNGDARPATPLPTSESDMEDEENEEMNGENGENGVNHENGDDSEHVVKRSSNKIDNSMVKEELKKVPRAYTPIR
jgi:hypothetical protein